VTGWQWWAVVAGFWAAGVAGLSVLAFGVLVAVLAIGRGR
jgi:hypothetical protein